MENEIKEIYFENSLIPVSVKDTEKILFQMKNCICKIFLKDGEKGTGFFCKIKFKEKMLHVLVTNNHILNIKDLKINNKITLTFNSGKDEEIRDIIIDKERKIYTNDKMDVTFIELKKDDKIQHYLEVDEDIMDTEKNIMEINYKRKSIYIMHYPKGNNVEVSYGLLSYIKDENICHLCNTYYGSSGAPILSLETFKVIGIHYGGKINNSVRFNQGTFIKYPVKEFNSSNKVFSITFEFFFMKKYSPQFYVNDESINEIIDESMYLYLTLFDKKFVENNKNKCKIRINSTEYELSSSYAIYKKDIIFSEQNFIMPKSTLRIDLIELNTITDMSFMFGDTRNYTNINPEEMMLDAFYGYFWNKINVIEISEWDTSKVINMKGMFQGAKIIPDISKFDTSNVKDMSYMFKGAYGNIPDISNWNTSNVINMKGMFEKFDPSNGRDMSCMFNGNIPDISNWNTSNVKDMSCMFKNRDNEYLPDISKWNTSKVENMCFIFGGNAYLKSLPDISNLNTSNVIYMNRIFSGCKSLISLPDISKWNISNVSDLSLMFEDCLSLKNIPDISKWNISKVNSLDGMFKGCKSLKNIPDISKWNISKVISLAGMLEGCKSLESIPNISKWNTNNVEYMNSMFYGCSSLKSFPSSSKWNNLAKKFDLFNKEYCLMFSYNMKYINILLKTGMT